MLKEQSNILVEWDLLKTVTCKMVIKLAVANGNSIEKTSGGIVGSVWGLLERGRGRKVSPTQDPITTIPGSFRAIENINSQ